MYHYPIMLLFEGLVSLTFPQIEGDKNNMTDIAVKNTTALKRMCCNAPENYSTKLPC